MNRKHTKGFSLIEILVVVGIIAILALIVLPNFIGILQGSKVQGTEGFFDALGIAIEQYKADTGQYPPSSLQGAPYNGGSHILRVALEDGLGTSIDWNGSYMSFKANQVGLVQGGSADYKLPTVTFANGATFSPENGVILDPYEYPIFYVRADDYDAAGARVDPLGTGPANETSYANPRSYQLISVGADGTTKPGELGGYAINDRVDNDGDGFTNEEDTPRSSPNNTIEDDIINTR